MPVSVRALVLRSTPIALTIAAYGMIYGAGAREPLGIGVGLLSSAIIFSGALQFALLGLLLSGASAAAILAAGLFLNARHVVLGAVLRPKIDAPRLKRVGLAWWLVDEAAALAIADEESPRRTLFVCGVLFYLSWIAGTAVGLVIGSVSGIAAFAEQFAPVLFVGLTALLATSRGIVIRALIAAALTYLAIAVLPGDKAFLGLIASLLVVLPGRGS
jgi:predicted branched-subunit amino acid permease